MIKKGDTIRLYSSVYNGICYLEEDSIAFLAVRFDGQKEINLIPWHMIGRVEEVLYVQPKEGING